MTNIIITDINVVHYYKFALLLKVKISHT